MRNTFPGYYRPTDDEFKKMWEEGIFIFDTNVLLDLYRYSQETVDTLFRIMESLKGRIWLPYQVSKEYHKNLPNIISDQANRYKKSVENLNSFKEQIEVEGSHPFLDSESHTEIREFCKKINDKLLEKQKEIEKSLTDNPIKERIADLFEGKIGEQFINDELEKIYIEGEKRYDKKIPPGYMDKSKNGIAKYGDLVIWKEILKKSKEIDIAIILVLRDTKEDWFLSVKEKIIGPRPELIEEIRKEKDILFYCYPTDSFLKYAEEHLETKINKEIIKEVEKYLNEPGVISETEAERIDYLLEKLGDTGPTGTFSREDYDVSDLPEDYDESDFEDISESEKLD